ncbi:head-tail connector protein [Pantoea ananatis]
MVQQSDTLKNGRAETFMKPTLMRGLIPTMIACCFDDDIRLVILFLVGHWDANREAVSEQKTSEMPLAVDALLQP